MISYYLLLFLFIIYLLLVLFSIIVMYILLISVENESPNNKK
jgi:hypothetical protein